jgi:Fic family protein
MSEDALSRAGRINARLSEWRMSLAGESTKMPLRFLELLAANPFITAKGGVAKLGVAFTTAQRAIERLERLGIVQPAGTAKRDRVYCEKALLDILEEPAQLLPGSH